MPRLSLPLHPPHRWASIAIAAATLLAATPSSPLAHEVPRGVTVHGYVRVEGRTLRLLVRAPLEAMRDIEFPTTGAGFLAITRSDSALRQAASLWIVDGVHLFADGERLGNARVTAVRASLPSDNAFATYETARQQLHSAALGDTVALPWMQAMLDVEIEAVLPRDSATITIEPRWAHLGVNTVTVLHVLDADGDERLLTFEGNPGRIGLNPGFLDTFGRFVVWGFQHILDGVDHLLFLLCLVIPVRRFWPLAGIVTSFTIAHSITLVASAFGVAPAALWFPPLIETLIALSIVYMAFENIVGARVDKRWMIAFGFGLVHGFGFSFALRDSLQFAGSNLLTALAAFNVGVELGQLLVLALAVPVLALLYKRVLSERMGAILLSAIVTHQAWHWMTERFAEFQAYDFALQLGRPLVIGLLQALMLLMVAGGVMWVMSLVAARISAMRAARAAMFAAIVIAGVAFTAPLDAQTPPHTTLSGIFTAKQAEQGRQVFNANCTGCHTAASHTGTVFTARWVGQPLSELFDYLASYMPKSAPGSLTEDEYVWVTAYLLRLNGMPAGTAELTADAKLLEAIRFDTVTAAKKTSGLSQSASLLQHRVR